MLSKIKQLRKEKKISLNDLSVKTGLTRQWLAKIENGTQEPRFCDVVKIFESLGFEIKAILKN